MKNAMKWFVGIFVISLVLFVGVYMSVYINSGGLNSVGGCEQSPVMNMKTGEQYTSYSDLRNGEGITLTDEQLKQGNIVEKVDGVYAQLCTEALQ